MPKNILRLMPAFFCVFRERARVNFTVDPSGAFWDNVGSSWRGCTGHNAFQETVEDRSSLHFGDSFPPDWAVALATVLLFCKVPSRDLPAVVIGKDLHRALPEVLGVDHPRSPWQIEIVRRYAARKVKMRASLAPGYTPTDKALPNPIAELPCP